MPEDRKIAVVIPAYRAASQVATVVRGVPDWIKRIYVIDDACPEKSGDAAKAAGDGRVMVLRRQQNGGVGAAVKTGYRQALADGFDIVVKMDADDQMDPAYLKALLKPILAGRADYTKGNRFRDLKALRQMPRVRLFGNSVLTFLVKAASGYWQMMDPTNGYTAINREALERLELDRVSDGYFFESDMLIRLNIAGAVAEDVAIPARYGDEQSSLHIPSIMPVFVYRLIRGMGKRILFKYFLYDFSLGSFYLTAGTLLTAFGLVFGGYKWWLSAQGGTAATTGTVMIAVLALLLGVQFLVQAINFDIQTAPKRPRDDE
ncbi:glycosyltransferase family 2 protein [Thalassospiraceae bacterium LMO-SO8]|nr:glycosyltransferase family 2 protein [Alphaproteobacteria bacterium LMO-S08]WND76825.1 glycosyltransferase family 2 protein [Thalassospiraceae bacterium LMO-SO8]